MGTLYVDLGEFHTKRICDGSQILFIQLIRLIQYELFLIFQLGTKGGFFNFNPIFKSKAKQAKHRHNNQR